MAANVASDDYDRLKEIKAFDDSRICCKGIADSNPPTIPRIFVHPQEKIADLNRTSKPSEPIPTVDLSHVLDPHRRPDIVREIHDAASTWGFFQVTHHGIPIADRDRLISAVRSFNEQPVEFKSRFYGRDPSASFSFSTNVDLFRSKAATWRDTMQLKLGPELPDFDRVPQVCREEMVTWGCHVTRLAEVLMELLSEGLGLDKGRLKELTCLEGRHMGAHYYPFCPQPHLTLGLASHSDPSVLTILVHNRVCGLQVRHEDKWVELEPVDGALVVNVGDLLQIMSNDEYKSVQHRVLANPSKEPRVSIPVFFQPSKRGENDYFGPLAELLSVEKPPHYRNFTMTEFLGQFFAKEIGGLTTYFKR